MFVVVMVLWKLFEWFFKWSLLYYEGFMMKLFFFIEILGYFVYVYYVVICFGGVFYDGIRWGELNILFLLNIWYVDDIV